MAYCTDCGAKREEGVEHICNATHQDPSPSQHTQASAHAYVQVAASTEPPTRLVELQGSGAEFAKRLWQQIIKGIQNPDGLAAELSQSKDLLNPIVHYIIFGLTFGLFVATFANKVVDGLMPFLVGLFNGLNASGDFGNALFDSSLVHAAVPFGPILLKTTLLMALVAAAYAVSVAIVCKLFHGKGEIPDYFKAISGTLIPASLTLLIATILVDASLFLGAIAFLVAMIYLCFFPVLYVYRAAGLSVSKLVYTLPLVEVIPCIVYLILAKAGL